MIILSNSSRATLLQPPRLLPNGCTLWSFTQWQNALRLWISLGIAESASSPTDLIFPVSSRRTSNRFPSALTAVTFPTRQPGQGFAINEVARRHGDFALVGTAVRVQVDSDGAVEDSRIAMFGVGPRAQRMPETESTLAGSAAEDLEELVEVVVSELSPVDDLHASERFAVESASAHRPTS